MSKQAYMRVENIEKKFGPFIALGGVDLSVYPGEVHALLGDNGAGKSTLIKILSGVHQPSSGSIYIEGAKREFRNPRDAAAAGIGTVYQDLSKAEKPRSFGGRPEWYASPRISSSLKSESG